MKLLPISKAKFKVNIIKSKATNKHWWSAEPTQNIGTGLFEASASYTTREGAIRAWRKWADLNGISRGNYSYEAP